MSDFKEVKKEYLYDWVFSFNPYDKSWNAFKMEEFPHYWGFKEAPKSLIKSSSIQTIMMILDQIEGDPSKLGTIETK